MTNTEPIEREELRVLLEKVTAAMFSYAGVDDTDSDDKREAMRLYDEVERMLERMETENHRAEERSAEARRGVTTEIGGVMRAIYIVIGTIAVGCILSIVAGLISSCG